MKKKLFILSYLISFNFLLLSNNSSAMMRKVDLSYLAHEAQYICYGQVEDLKSEWNESSTLIFTTVTLSVFESVDQKSPGVVTFKIPGGIVGDIGQKNSNSPNFQLNEKIIVFITPNSSIAGGYQGKFHVQEETVLERGLPVKSFLNEIKQSLSDPQYGAFSPRLIEQNDFNYTVTRYHWCGANPMGEYFYINANTQDVGNEESAVSKAAQTWNSCGACFQFDYGGLTVTSTTGRDEENIILWGKKLSHPVLAQTNLWYTPSTGCILEADCEFNDNESWNTNGIEDFDIQTCMLHEFGHYLCLEHSNNPKAIMYAYYQGVQRTLSSDDIAGIKAMYGDCDSPQPSWDSTYPMMLESSEKLNILRDYRDRVLLQHPNGKYQVKRLYSQSNELLDILISDPALILEARRLIEKNLPEIQKILDHQDAVLQDTQAIHTFIGNLSSRSSLRTRLWLHSLGRQLRRSERREKNFWGFHLQPEDERRLRRGKNFSRSLP